MREHRSPRRRRPCSNLGFRTGTGPALASVCNSLRWLGGDVALACCEWSQTPHESFTQRFVALSAGENGIVTVGATSRLGVMSRRQDGQEGRHHEGGGQRQRSQPLGKRVAQAGGIEGVESVELAAAASALASPPDRRAARRGARRRRTSFGHKRKCSSSWMRNCRHAFLAQARAASDKKVGKLGEPISAMGERLRASEASPWHNAVSRHRRARRQSCSLGRAMHFM